MSEELKLPEEWAESLGHVSSAPRDGRRVYSPEYRAAAALHHWTDDAYHASGSRLRVTRAVFDAALIAPGVAPPGRREPAPVAEALSPCATAAVKAKAIRISAPTTTPAEVAGKSSRHSKEIG
jgi:hypothetical protein